MSKGLWQRHFLRRGKPLNCLDKCYQRIFLFQCLPNMAHLTYAIIFDNHTVFNPIYPHLAYLVFGAKLTHECVDTSPRSAAKCIPLYNLSGVSMEFVWFGPGFLLST